MALKATKRKKRPNIRAARNACDKMFSQIVRERVQRCEVCNVVDNLQAAHIIRREYAHTRTDFANVFVLCAKHHMGFHADPAAWMAFVDARIGRPEYDRLHAKAEAGVGVKFDWIAERERLKAIHAQVFA